MITMPDYSNVPSYLLFPEVFRITIDHESFEYIEYEALTSVISRASWHYSLKPKDLLKRGMGLEGVTSEFLTTNCSARLNLNVSLKGYLKKIESALGPPLHYNTFISCSHVLERTNRGIMDRRHKWCPLCLKEREPLRDHRGIPYSLYWTLAGVRYCIKHFVELSKICANCLKLQPFINTTYEPGFCDYCGFGLSNSPAIPASEQSVIQTINSNRVFLDQQISNLVDHEHEIFCANIDAIMKTANGLSTSNLSTICGFDAKVLESWASGNKRPSYTNLKLFIQYIGLTAPSDLWMTSPEELINHKLADFFTQEFGLQSVFSFEFRNKRDEHVLYKIYNHLLDIYINLREPESIKAIARQYNVSVGLIEYHFGEEANRAVKKLREQQEKSKTQRKNDLSIQMRILVRRQLSKNRHPKVSSIVSKLPHELLYNISKKEILTLFNSIVDEQMTKQCKPQ